jgi:hypothetical protein
MLACAEHMLHIVFDVTLVGVMGWLPLFLYRWGLTSFLRYGEV